MPDVSGANQFSSKVLRSLTEQAESTSSIPQVASVFPEVASTHLGIGFRRLIVITQDL